MDIQLPGVKDKISSKHPIVIIGPNGVGKTRLGVKIAQSNGGDRVAALRNVEIPEIPLQRFEQASQEVTNALNQLMGEHWRQSYELRTLMAEILAEDRELAVQYRGEHVKNPASKPDDKFSNTRLHRIVNIWNRHFPGRTINIDYQPIVVRIANGQTYKYPIAQMSEGERTALYLAARVLSSKSKVLVIDEPETFFHPLLARNLWDDLEAEVPDIRFVYITHDIPFALSRRGAQFAIARNENQVDLLPPTSAIPSDVVAEVLGAASFSISASRLIFCEGKEKSLDNPMLAAWHNCPKTAVVPVGSCDAVRECVSVFRSQGITSGLEAFGYIDRDGWPDTFLASEKFVKAHSVSEIEGFFCLKDVFLALAIYNGCDAAEAAKRYNDFLTEAQNHFKGVVLHKEILARAKKRVEIEQRALFNPIKPDPDLTKVRAAFVGVSPQGGWPSYLATVFQDEENRLSGSLKSPADFARDFPAKSYFSIAAKHLQLVEDIMVQTFCKALYLTDEEGKSEKNLMILRDAIVASLKPLMWPRVA